MKTVLSILFLALIIFFIKPGALLNFWLGFFVFFQSVLLLFLVEKKFRNSVIRKIVLIIPLITICVFVMKSGVYRDTFKVTNLEKNQLWTREELYRRELGRFGRSNFGNKFIEQTKLIIDKTTQKITESYELNHYFSFETFSFYSLFFLPFFILGFLSLLAKEIKTTLYYLGLATVGATLVYPNMTYWLFIPLVNLAVLLGIKNIIIFFKTKRK